MKLDTHFQESFTLEFKNELLNKFGVGENFARKIIPKKLNLGRRIKTWEDLIDPNQPMAKAYIHFALSNVVRGRASRDYIISLTGIKTGKMLDIGSAYGGMVAAFAEKKFNAQGIEIDSYWAEIGNLNLLEKGLPQTIRCQDFISANFEEKYSIVTCNDVIEHILEPEYALLKIISLLESGGVLYLVIPNATSWDHIIRDGHYGTFGMNLLSHYSAREYYNITCKNKFQKDYSCGEFYPFGWYENMLNSLGCENILTPSPTKKIPSLEEFAGIVNKLKIARSQWNNDSLPEILSTEIIYRFNVYLRDIQNDYRNLQQQNHMQFIRKYFEPFWTIIAKKKEN